MLYDFILWVISRSLKFQKSQRFLFAERLSKIAPDFYDLILEAIVAQNQQTAFTEGRCR